MNHPKCNFGRRYDEDYKRQTVALIESQQRSIRQLSRELGVSEWSLTRWCKQDGKNAAAGGPPPPGGPPAVAGVTDLEAENARLRRDLEVISRQRDILISELGNVFFAARHKKGARGGGRLARSSG